MSSAEKQAQSKLFVESLRELADFYEAHPECPLPSFPSLNIFADRSDEAVARQQFRAFGAFEKEFLEDWFVARKRFGVITLELNAKREQVCRKVVVGTRQVPERVVPAQPETVIPAHTEEITEWQCEPILDAKAGAA